MTKCVPFRLEIPIPPSRPHESGHLINRISVYPDSCGRGVKTILESGFKTARFRRADSLVSCGQKVDLCNNDLCGGGLKSYIKLKLIKQTILTNL